MPLRNGTAPTNPFQGRVLLPKPFTLPPAAASNPERARKKYVAVACDSCRSRKEKCSGEKPRCNGCRRSGLTCSYGIPRNQERQVLLEHKKLLAALVKELWPKVDDPDRMKIDNVLREVGETVEVSQWVGVPAQQEPAQRTQAQVYPIEASATDSPHQQENHGGIAPPYNHVDNNQSQLLAPHEHPPPHTITQEEPTIFDEEVSHDESWGYPNAVDIWGFRISEESYPQFKVPMDQLNNLTTLTERLTY
ncbi:hypothetical protein IQ07DRAFT_642159 [Pyrenochaeta sp. DS3sAY3a]|nr:hypothetical protein IQ07DRAFT_642159 [Pyrenochaeta sp. DS3sAY3a]